MATNGRRLDLQTLETWLWDAACAIRGPLDAPKFKDYILPLIFLKRLSDVFEDELQRLAQEFGSPELAATLVERDRKLVRFYLPEMARWPAIRQRTTGLGEYLTDVVRAVTEIHIRPMRRKWASCSSKGRSTFDTELLRQPAAFRAEVIVHELLHLKVPNHGRLFKALLRAYLAEAMPEVAR